MHCAVSVLFPFEISNSSRKPPGHLSATSNKFSTQDGKLVGRKKGFKNYCIEVSFSMRWIKKWFQSVLQPYLGSRIRVLFSIENCEFENCGMWIMFTVQFRCVVKCSKICAADQKGDYSLIRGVLIQSCPARPKNFTNYIFCHPQFSGVIQNIENHCAILTSICLCRLLSK